MSRGAREVCHEGYCLIINLDAFRYGREAQQDDEITGDSRTIEEVRTATGLEQTDLRDDTGHLGLNASANRPCSHYCASHDGVPDSRTASPGHSAFCNQSEW